MFWNEESARRAALLHEQRRITAASVTLTIYTTEYAKTALDQLDIAECAEYDRRADFRKAEYDDSMFRVSIDLLLGNRS